VHNLSFSADVLAASAAGRGTLLEVVESDYMSRATAILLAYGGTDKVFWRYAPLSGVPGAIALQSYANLSRTLGGARESGSTSLPGSDFEVASFRGSGRLVVLTWRKAGGDEALPAVIPGFDGYDLRAWSADAASLKDKYGVELPVDSGGSTALLVSERPVLISAQPAELKDSLTLIASDSAAQAGKGLQAKLASFVQAQKAKAAEKVGAWVDEQQQSLMQTLKNSFNQWLRKSLGLAKM
jgi:gas vesicle protein